MKTTIVLLSLIAALTVKAQEPPLGSCLTNVAVVASSGVSYTVSGGDSFACFNQVESYTNLMCSQLIGQSCYVGPVLNFAFPCTSHSTTIATVSFTCNATVICGPSQGGPIYCGPGDSFNITVPPNVCTFNVRLFSVYGCCSLTYCEATYPAYCAPSGGGDPQ